jgi:ABC-type branched-subunit amino acid transport system substrate-binding protein
MTGNSGVQGLQGLIPLAPSCTFLTGPGRNSVAASLTPVVNQFEITQLDYNSGSDVFSNKLMYPYFSRTIPTDYNRYAAFAAACSYFGWERVIFISTNDIYGQASIAAAQQAMDEQTIMVESTFELPDSSNASIASAFSQILTNSISRVIIVLIPISSTSTALTIFNLIGLYGMNETETQYIFFFDRDVCEYMSVTPNIRIYLMSSICTVPYMKTSALAAINVNYSNSTAIQTQVQQLLVQGGFSATGACFLGNISAYSAFALDAGFVIRNVVQRALSQNIPLTSSSSILNLVRQTTITTPTGTWSIDSSGNRNYAAYMLNIQTPTGVVTFGKMDSNSFPAFQYLGATIIWYDNTTSIPSSTFRTIAFIASQTITANPGTIVMSVLGFCGTIATFFFCYRHYKMQKLIELSLAGAMPTAEEMERMGVDMKALTPRPLSGRASSNHARAE